MSVECLFEAGEKKAFRLTNALIKPRAVSGDGFSGCVYDEEGRIFRPSQRQIVMSGLAIRDDDSINVVEDEQMPSGLRNQLVPGHCQQMRDFVPSRHGLGPQRARSLTRSASFGRHQSPQFALTPPPPLGVPTRGKTRSFTSGR